MYDIEYFVNEVQGALHSWISSHNLDSWVYDESYKYLRDALDYVLEAHQEDVAEDLYNDGMFYCGCGWSGDGYEVLDYNRCPDCGLFTSKYDMAMCIDWAKDLYWEIEQIDTDSLPSYVLESAYEKWINYVFPMIPELIEDAEEALDQIECASDPIELLAALLMACHCCHVGGVIVTDHGGIDDDLIDKISDGGLESVFDQEDIDYFMGV